MAILNRLFDERFLTHRQRSTSAAGIVGGVFAISLFYYRYLHDRIANWDLLAVALAIVGIKVGLMAWYSLTD